MEGGAERTEIKEPPPIPPADGDASPGDGGTWEDVAEDDPILTPEGDDDEPSSEEAPKVIKKKVQKAEQTSKDKKEHVNVVFIGHVDAGKSTIGGQIMALTGMVDKRTLEKYEREAREKSRESWYLSWALDTNQEGELMSFYFEVIFFNFSFCFSPVSLPSLEYNFLIRLSNVKQVYNALCTFNIDFSIKYFVCI